MKISNCEVFGFKGAIRGMRNPYNSWDKSDSHDEVIGSNDLELCKKLIKAGSDHRKFLRMIHVQVDVKAPLYWWEETDTYKVGTVANSCSTMPTITAKKFGFEDFEMGYRDDMLGDIIFDLNMLRKECLEKSEEKVWYEIIKLLPSSYLQLRTLDLNYETLMRMYFARKNHRLTEWHTFCEWIETLPYMEEFLRACK